MRRLAVGCIVAVCSIGLNSMASAADLPTKAPIVVPVSYNWSGFYLGVAGGYSWGTTQHTNAVSGISAGSDSNLKGGIFGGTYGYNWQLGSWVLGLEGDISWSDIKDAYASTGGFCPVGFECTTKLRWLGTDRVRLGYAWDRYLVYATGGVAYGSVNAYIANSTCCTNETVTRVGYTVGGGIEAMLVPNWSAKLEYLYVDLGDRTNYHLLGVNNDEHVLVRSSIVRLGLNYHFAGPR